MILLLRHLSFIRALISVLLTIVFLKSGGKLAFLISIFQVHQYRTEPSQLTFFSLSLLINACKRSVLGYDVQQYCLFVQSPPLTHPQHFKVCEFFFLYVALSQFIELSSLSATLIIFFSEKCTYLLTGTEVIEANHGFKHSVAMRTKAINTEAVHFFLSACCIDTCIFIIWPCSLKTGCETIFEATGLVLTRSKPIGF